MNLLLNKKHVLLIGFGIRLDTYSYLSKDKKNSYSILIDTKEEEKNIKTPNFISCTYFREDYYTAHMLVQHINPDIIVFNEIFDFVQMAIAITANKKKIKTIFLDHGAVGDLSEYKRRTEKNKRIITKNKWKSIFKRLLSILKIRLFYFSTLPYISKESLSNYITLPLAIYRHTNAKALNMLPFNEKKMTHYIFFNKNNYKLYNYLYHLEDSKISYSGIPYFDFLIKGARNHCLENDYILYIDHPLLELGLCNWDNEHHKCIAYILNEFSKKNKITIYIKLHPKSNISLWNEYGLDSEYIVILQTGNFNSLYACTKMILGFSSSMIPGFLSAQKNVVLLGWHPKEKKVFGVDFSEMGLCHKSLNINDLDRKYNFWQKNNLVKKNKNAYNTFLRKYNYPFDGRASERIIEIINK